MTNLIRNIIALAITLILASITLYALLPRNELITQPPAEVIVDDIKVIVEPEPLPPILRDGSAANPTIPWCESKNQQFNSAGTVLRGDFDPRDIGKYQISLLYHGERAEKLGINLYTEEGNTEFALLLYEESGTTPWNWSRKCWLR